MKLQGYRFILIGAAIFLFISSAFSNNNDDDVMMSLIFDSIDKSFGPPNSAQSQSISQIITSFMIYGDRDWRKLIYILATAYHESRFQLVKEKRGAPGSDLYNRQAQYWDTGFYGRGFVQLTHRENYAKMGKRIGIDLVNNPDLALDRRYAADIIVIGMMEGIFTGLGLPRFINASEADYYNARKIVNSLDRAQLIADYAVKIQSNLQYQVA